MLGQVGALSFPLSRLRLRPLVDLVVGGFVRGDTSSTLPRVQRIGPGTLMFHIL